jgi:hypothetical protein
MDFEGPGKFQRRPESLLGIIPDRNIHVLIYFAQWRNSDKYQIHKKFLITIPDTGK